MTRWIVVHSLTMFWQCDSTKFLTVITSGSHTCTQKSYLTTDNPQNICEWVTTTAFQKYDAYFHICKIMAVIACSLIHTGVTSFKNGCSVTVSGVARVQRLPGHLVGVSPPHSKGCGGMPHQKVWNFRCAFWGLLRHIAIECQCSWLSHSFKSRISALVGTFTVERECCHLIINIATYYHKVNFNPSWLVNFETA